MTRYIAYGVFVLGTVLAAAQPESRAGTIQVDVSYKGSGTVNASHKIYVVLWDDPGR